MARNWKDMLPEKVISNKSWFKNHPKPTKVKIEEIELKEGYKDNNESLCIKVNVDDCWIRLNKENCMVFDRAWGSDIDKWIGKSVIISRGKTMVRDEMMDQMIMEACKK